jgi:2-C-methyl-D-erythritol 2,4-cyclodiphosphate synthase
VNTVGIGYDAHRFIEGRPLIVGGVVIDYNRGLDGHSDADVLVHAIIDALLGAASMGDIGMHFPDTRPEYAGISSLKLLKKVGEMICRAGFRICNIDSVIVAQEPKMRPHISAMRSNIADKLDISIGRVNVKATTTEGMGFEGRKEGIGAQAIVLLEKIENAYSHSVKLL